HPLSSARQPTRRTCNRTVDTAPHHPPTRAKLTMPRLSAIESSEATGRARELLDAVQARLDMTPNLIRTLAHSPAALHPFLSFGAALDSGGLPEKLREQLALAVAE